jgi:hypothetical protein
LRFGDIKAERLVRVVNTELQEGAFWDTLARSIFGSAPRDWDDQGEAKFYKTLQRIKGKVEQQAVDLTTEVETTIEVSLSIGKSSHDTYRFRQAELSDAAQRVLKHFKYTLRTAGRPLSPDERRQVVLNLLQYLLGEENDN